MKESCRDYNHFCHEEIVSILQMREKGIAFRKIGNLLGRGENADSSIRRFLKRNAHPFPGVWKKLDVYERARFMYERALSRRRIPRKKSKLSSNPALKKKVIELLEDEDASPRDISYRIPDELPGERIAYTTIYHFTKHERPDLRRHHRLRGKERKQRLKPARKHIKRGAPEKTPIRQRPSRVAERTECGHYEADTILSPKKSSGAAILTLRELKSRERWFFRLMNLKAATTLAILQGFFRMLPPHMRRSLTIDNGSENEHLYKLETVFPGFKVYYCDPYCAWQRGSVEQANQEFRWYYPKGTDFGNVSSQDVRIVQEKLNRRRMVCLQGKSSRMVFEEALHNPPLIHLVGAEVLRSQRALRHAVDIRFEQSSGLYLPSQALSG